MYIRAAIEQNTGIKLSLKETVDYLVEEGLITRAKAKNLIFPGYSYIFGDKKIIKEDKVVEPLPVDQVIRD